MKQRARVTLSAIDPSSTPGIRKASAKAEHDPDQKRLRKLQERLYAEGKRSLLVVLQGTDTAGKDGAIIHVFASVDPQGVQVTSFKTPTEEERKHDFLRRIHNALPVAGRFGIFNRSQYEDVLIVRVRQLVPEAVWSKRYGQIKQFEKEVSDSGTAIVKIMLHISPEEQRKRLLARLEDP
ncbi:MAG: polyphosphate kinase 2 family protein, partial [Chloroflexota bacterium]|nr:polyphosphate kinase 2 family protein [Chloroflexota bacterium]